MQLSTNYKLPAISLICATLTAMPALAVEGAKTTDDLQPIKHLTTFEVKFGGLSVGEMNFKIQSDRKTYTLIGSGRTKGIAKWFSSGNAKIKAAGSLLNDTIDPALYTISVTDKKKTESLNMALKGGQVASLAMKPDKSKKHLKDNYYTISEADFKNIIDPVSTLVLPVPYEKATDPKQACNHTHRVYDGETRYDMKLSYKKRAKLDISGYDGWAYVCRLKYAPVSGHKKTNKNVKRMAKNNDMEIWIAPMQASNIFTPIRINIPTPVGRFTAEPTYFGPAK